jgi:hypothetical protein
MQAHLTGILAIFAAGAALAAPARADVAINWPNYDVYYLYYRDGTDVVRARCQADSALRDRSTCQDATLRVAEADLHAAAAAHFGSDRDLHDRLAGEIYTKIARIDVKALEFLAGVPDVEQPDLRAAIADAEADLAVAMQRVADLADQIARAEAELAQHEDPDLRATLRELTDARGAALVERESRQTALNGVRQAFIAANSRFLDMATYEALQRQRAQLVTDLGRERDLLAEEVDKGVKLNKAMRLVADEGFVWEHAVPSSPFDTLDAAIEIARAFDAVEERQRTFVGEVANDNFTSIWVPLHKPLRSITCTFTDVAAGDPRLYVSGGDIQFRGHVQGTQFYVSDERSSGAVDSAFDRLVGQDAFGVWMFMVTDGDAAWASARTGRCVIVVGR